MKCPECKTPMAEQSFEGLHGTRVTIDVCHGCRGLWFDTNENRQLSPTGTVSLFREVHGRTKPRRPRGHGALSCPRCDAKLALAHDRAHNHPFQYSRCTQGHGHFITFFQFLREKGIARDLHPKELIELRKHVDTLLCSDCGEPVRLANMTACARCRAPLSLLDPDCVSHTVRDMQQAQGSRRDVAPEVAAQLLMDNLRMKAFHRPPDPHSHAIPAVTLTAASGGEIAVEGSGSRGVDLIATGMELILNVLQIFV